MFHLCSDSAVLEGPTCALSLLHLSQVGCKRTLKWYYRWLCQVKYWMCVVLWSYSQSRFQTAFMGSQHCCPACLPLLVPVGSQCFPGCVQSCSVGQATPLLQGSVIGSVHAGQGCCRPCSGLLLITGSSCSTCQLQLTRTSKPTLLSFHHQALAGQQRD